MSDRQIAADRNLCPNPNIHRINVQYYDYGLPRLCLSYYSRAIVMIAKVDQRWNTMAKFIIQPHGRLQELVAHEKGYFTEEGLDYEIRGGNIGERKRMSIHPA